MKTVSLITIALILLFTNTGIGIAQEYRETLEPIYVGSAHTVFAQDVSVTDLHGYLINKEDFSFRDEIKQAQKLDATVLFVAFNNSEELTTEDYLRTLRKVGNRSENLIEFTQLLSEELSIKLATIQASEQLEALYQVIRQNTFYGQLDNVGSDLTWL